MPTLETVRDLLIDTLQLGGRGQMLRGSSPLLGALPELDSQGVLQVLAAIEGRFGITIPDDDVTADAFATLDSLKSFIGLHLKA